MSMSMSMDMGSSSMDMASSAMSTMASMVMSSSSMNMGSATATSSMAMHMGSATATATATDTAAMSMDMSGGMMHMNYYLTRKYQDYPVVFEKLYATDKKDAFGIFVLILATAFVYKFLLFISWCLEVHWFKKWNKSKKIYNSENDENDVDDELTETEYTETGGQIVSLPKLPNLMFDIFAPSWREMCHDVIRILLIFTSTMLIYMLMLVAMTYVLTYVFAIITGLALSEVFYNRCKISLLRRWNIQREIQKARNCPGASNCKCGRHPNQSKSSPDTDSLELQSSVSNSKYNEKSKDPCHCEPDIHAQDKAIERNMSESARQQEQSNDMDTNLLPAEKFT